MKVRKFNNAMCALRLTDDNGEIITELEWCQNEDAEWVNHDIQSGMEIIGLYMSKSGSAEYVQSLGFILWKTNNNATD